MRKKSTGKLEDENKTESLWATVIYSTSYLPCPFNMGYAMRSIAEFARGTAVLKLIWSLPPRPVKAFQKLLPVQIIGWIFLKNVRSTIVRSNCKIIFLSYYLVIKKKECNHNQLDLLSEICVSGRSVENRANLCSIQEEKDIKENKNVTANKNKI